MKYVVLVGDGMADRPCEQLDGKTPLEVAKTPNMDYIAKQGKVGIARTIPQGFAPGSDVANLSIIGYDPRIYYSGRGPLEAANLGVDLKDDEIAFRCNLVTADGDKLIDYSSGHISNKEAAVLINYLNKKLSTSKIRFYPGVSYRHLLVIKDKNRLEGLLNTRCVPPHDITGWGIKENLPKGEVSALLIELMEKSRKLLLDHEINQVRVDLGENPGNMIWLWGQGIRPKMPLFKEKYGVEGSVISAVDLVKGIGRLIGLKVIKVPGATGFYDTNYLGKAKYALASLKDRDFVFVHVEAPDEAGHNGDLRAKIGAIENFDRLVVGTIVEHFKNLKDYRILVSPDHMTPISIRTHSDEPVCFAICGKGIEADNIEAFNEAAAKNTSFIFENAHELIDYLIKNKK